VYKHLKVLKTYLEMFATHLLFVGLSLNPTCIPQTSGLVLRKAKNNWTNFQYLLIIYPGVNFINVLCKYFCTKFWSQKLQSWNVTRESCVVCFCTEKACVKCWWNWHLHAVAIILRRIIFVAWFSNVHIILRAESVFWLILSYLHVQNAMLRRIYNFDSQINISLVVVTLLAC